MKLPNGKKAIISKIKLTDYILSETHELGKFKAKFFIKLGFNIENIDIFEKELRRIAEFEEVKIETKSPYGIKYILESKVETPSGKTTKMRTIWIINKGENLPRFVTIYPV